MSAPDPVAPQSEPTPKGEQMLDFGLFDEAKRNQLDLFRASSTCSDKEALP
ncbi:hypothetical protein ABID26_001178 [Mesorhizobium shonense]|uniref:Uncharacterized protein n=1 Tax=Mesorhizobium shonense TaxID=1209948 RepID=A0ABV2HMM2_9HYPH